MNVNNPVKRWRAFFSNYQDLTKGLLFEIGHGPEIYANISADFEVVNASSYDSLLIENEILNAKLNLCTVQRNGAIIALYSTNGLLDVEKQLQVMKIKDEQIEDLERKLRNK